MGFEATSTLLGPTFTLLSLVLLYRFVRPLCWWDLPIVYMVLLSNIYLQLSPMSALLSRSLPGVRARSGNYVLFQVFAFFLFSVPLILVYSGLTKRRASRVALRRLSINRPPNISSMPIAAVLFGASAIRVLLASQFGLWRLRIGEIVADKVASVPIGPYYTFRIVGEMAIPLIPLAIWLALSDPSLRRRRLSLIGAAISILVQLIFAILNSRYSILILGLAIVLGLVQVRNSPLVIEKRLVRRLVLGALAVYVLGTVVLSMRESASSQTTINILGDNQGLNRFNCADLVAQTHLLSAEDAPSLDIWAGYAWTYRRFIDPEGFNQFRRSIQTTAKARIAERYLGIKQLDYYSCAATDAIGAMGPLGLVALGLVIGSVLAWSARLLMTGRPRNRAAGFWLVFLVASFDQEFGQVLFAWPLRVPALVGTLVVIAWSESRSFFGHPRPMLAEMDSAE